MRKFLGYGLFYAVALVCGSAHAFNLDRAAAESGVERKVLRAIALQESRIRDPESGLVKPWPWVLGTPEGSYWYRSRSAAAKALRRLIEKGYRNIDVGAFQVNLRWHSDLVDRPEDLLDPNINLWAAVQVLYECRQRFGDSPSNILGCYHAGDPAKRHGAEYADKVLEIAQGIKD